MFYPYELWSIWEIMESFDVGKLLGSIAGLSNLAHLVRDDKPITITIENYQDIKSMIDFICNELERIDLPVSLVSARALRDIIHREVEEKDVKNFPLGKLMFFSLNSTRRYQNYSKELLVRVSDELSAKKVMILQSGRERLYKPNETIFGKEVSDKFPKWIEDITEAGNCFALGRYTASVFHLMRIMESAVQRFGRKLKIKINPKEENWYKILQHVDKVIKALPENNQKEKVKKQKYAATSTHLDNVRRAWRNDVMHPKSTYTPEEAEDILGAVRLFIRDLVKIL